jgi:hypothetical protein
VDEADAYLNEFPPTDKMTEVDKGKLEHYLGEIIQEDDHTVMTAEMTDEDDNDDDWDDWDEE